MTQITILSSDNSQLIRNVVIPLRRNEIKLQFV